jgi:hypothetical protein
MNRRALPANVVTILPAGFLFALGGGLAAYGGTRGLTALVVRGICTALPAFAWFVSRAWRILLTGDTDAEARIPSSGGPPVVVVRRLVRADLSGRPSKRNADDLERPILGAVQGLQTGSAYDDRPAPATRTRRSRGVTLAEERPRRP